jgi:hypothetical protein
MSVKCDRRGGPFRGRFFPPNFKELPFATGSQFAKQPVNHTRIALAKKKRLGEISERETHPPSSCQWAAYFQEGNEDDRLAVLRNEKRGRLVAVCLAQDFRPRRAVKESRVGMRGNKRIPIRIARRIHDVYFPGSRRKSPGNPSRRRAKPFRDRREGLGWH